jgi:hypothetical protein
MLYYYCDKEVNAKAAKEDVQLKWGMVGIVFYHNMFTFQRG